jgi:hypothetical protein
MRKFKDWKYDAESGVFYLRPRAKLRDFFTSDAMKQVGLMAIIFALILFVCAVEAITTI